MITEADALNRRLELSAVDILRMHHKTTGEMKQ